MSKIFFILTFLILTMVFSNLWAASDIGGVAQNIIEPVSIVSQFLMTACFIIGASFLFTAIIKYVEYRRNPLASPLSTVIFLFIAGIVLILLPILTMYSMKTPNV